MDTVSLTIPGAKQSVELENPHGIFYKIRVNGEVIKRQRGSWNIPLRSGKEARLKAKGLIPGFQVLRVDGDTIYDMGTGVSRLERIVMFAPVLLVIWIPFGILLGLVLFLTSIPAVKNLQMPRPLRIALPIINFVAGALILTLITKHLGPWALG